MWFVPHHVSCPSLVRCLAGHGRGGRPVPFPPCLALGRVPPRERACASEAVWRRGVGGREGGSVCHPPSGASLGGPGGGRHGIALPRSVPLPPLGGHHIAPVRVGALPPRCGLRGCACVPAQDCRPVEVTVQAGGRRFRDARRMGPVALGSGRRCPLPWGVPLAEWGGCRGQRPLSRPSAYRMLGRGRGEEGGGQSGALGGPPSVPWFTSPAAVGGGLKVLAQAPPTASTVALRAPPW